MCSTTQRLSGVLPGAIFKGLDRLSSSHTLPDGALLDCRTDSGVSPDAARERAEHPIGGHRAGPCQYWGFARKSERGKEVEM